MKEMTLDLDVYVLVLGLCSNHLLTSRFASINGIAGVLFSNLYSSSLKSKTFNENITSCKFWTQKIACILCALKSPTSSKLADVTVPLRSFKKTEQEVRVRL